MAGAIRERLSRTEWIESCRKVGQRFGGGSGGGSETCLNTSFY